MYSISRFAKLVFPTQGLRPWTPPLRGARLFGGKKDLNFGGKKDLNFGGSFDLNFGGKIAPLKDFLTLATSNPRGLSVTNENSEAVSREF